MFDLPMYRRSLAGPQIIDSLAAVTNANGDPSVLGWAASGVVPFLLRHRWPLIATLAAACGWITEVGPADLSSFAREGGQLLGGHVGRVYDDSRNQAGPLQLVLNRVLVIGTDHGDMQPAVLAVANVALVLLVMNACRVLSPLVGGRSAPRELAVGALTLLWLTPNGMWSGHPLELAVPCLWIYAVTLLRRDRWLAPAVALGVAVSIAPWAVLAFPCVLVADRLATAVTAAIGATVISLGLYLPFVLSGHFLLFHFRWAVSRSTLVHLVAPHLASADWGERVVQALVVGAGCAYVARHYRYHPMIAALAPLTAALLRVGTDPVQMNYYWVPVGACAIAVLAVAPHGTSLSMRLGAVLLAYMTWLAYATNWTVAGFVVCLLVAIFIEHHARRIATPVGYSFTSSSC